MPIEQVAGPPHMFNQLPSAKGRSTQSLILSLVIHATLVVSILAVGFTVKSVVEPRRNTHVQWITPVAQVPGLPRVRRIQPKLKAALKPAPKAFSAPSLRVSTRPAAIQEPPPAIPQMVAEPAIKPSLALAVIATPIPNPPAAVRTGGFATAAPVSEPAARLRQVAAAGFGDAGLASMSAGPRSVAAAGFGDAGVSLAPANPRGQVRSSGFGNAVSAAPSTSAVRSPAPPEPTVAQILEKPRPAYTEEARRLLIEGEVQLEVVFGASGQIHILRVVRGLGHGLDENAVSAAKAIRFLPARRDGRSVDSTALVHIFFQLAS
jgi:TonB family protein